MILHRLVGSRNWSRVDDLRYAFNSKSIVEQESTFSLDDFHARFIFMTRYEIYACYIYIYTMQRCAVPLAFTAVIYRNESQNVRQMVKPRL